ncbi:hypothetical protein TNCV_3670261 [Trichonephila clavipes]|nr:hypothetical protein TNCV_3670261 [Trichonephila clavipes]
MWGGVSDELGERFYQDIVAMECRYQGRWDEPMLADYCWTVIRDTLGLLSTYKKQSQKEMLTGNKLKITPEF